MLSPRDLLSGAWQLSGIGSHFLKHSQIHRDLTPRAVARLLRQVGRGLRGPVTVIRLHAFAAPQRPALCSETLRLSYGELDARVNRLAHNLQRLGIHPGDRFALLLDNGHEFIETAAALTHLGATTVQIGYRLKPKEVAHILSHSASAGLLFHDRYLDVVREALAMLPAAPRVLVTAGAARGPDLCGYEDLCQSGPGDNPPYPRDGGYGGLMLYTSGTTGKSKGARRDLKQTSYLSVLAMLAELPLYRDDRHLILCPLYHAAAPAFAAFVFAVGGCVIVPAHFDAAAVPRQIEQERVTSSVMVPTMLGRLVGLPEADLRRHDLSSLRWLMSVAAPLPTELARRTEERLGPVLYNMYGSTETGVVSLARPGEHTARPGTIGRKLFGNDIRLLAPDGTEVGVGEVGEIYVKNGTLASYFRDEHATRSAMKDGRFSVGDLGYRDADGYYYLADRKVDMVISAGVNIYPLEIEQRLHQHPAVEDCAVVGVPDPEWGESLAAFVVLRPGQGQPGPQLADELREFVGAELANYKKPRRIEFVDGIPRNPTGKILKRELRQRLLGP